MDESNSEETRWRLSRYAPPEPASGEVNEGEWTVEEVTTPHHGKWDGLRYITDANGRRLGSMNEHEAKSVVNAHNAALAAERTSKHDVMVKYEEQLAAETESRRQAVDVAIKLRNQLAAVKALTEGNKTGCGTCHTILAALAKVK